MEKRLRFGCAFALLLALLAGLAALSVGLGSVRIPPAELPRLLLSPDEGTAASVLWKIRLPRLCAGALLGGALGLSGYLLQTLFHNPIAGPFILGVSSGAKLFVALVMIVLSGTRWEGFGSVSLVLAAFLGALASMGFVLLCARRVRRASMLIVSGVMIGYICSAITDFLITFADDASIVNLHNWSRGSFSGIAWEQVCVMTCVTLASAAAAFLLSKPLAAYQLGEAYAQSMGVDVKRFRIVLVLLSSLLSACVTAFAGPVSFVGIAVPHLVKALLGSAKPLFVLPACFLGGSVFCIGCDLIARTAFPPLELGISAVTALFGAPVVIAVMLRRRAGE